MSGKVNTYFRSISFFLILTFSAQTITSGTPIYTFDTPLNTTLAAQIISSDPMVDPDMTDIYRLKSFLRYQALSSDEGLSTEVDLRSTFFDTDIAIYFSTPFFIGLKPGRDEGAISNIKVVRAEIDGKIYYVFMSPSDSSGERVAVYSERDYQEKIRGFADAGRIDPGQLERLKTELTLDDSPVAVVDETDDSVRLAAEFLLKIGAKKLNEKLAAFIRGDRIYVTEGNAIISGGIIINSNEMKTDRAFDIIEQLLLYSVSSGLVSSDIHKFRQAFLAFVSNRESFDLLSFDSGLASSISSIETVLSEPSNEGGIEFLEEAYNTIIDIRDVTLEQCRISGVIDDIELVFRNIAMHDLEDYNRSAGPGKTLNIDDMPGVGNRFIIGRVADSIIPTSIEKEDGTVIINENFVKVMYKLAQTGMKGDGGEIYGVQGDLPTFADPDLVGTTRSPLGNLYYSIIYSIAIHAIRGHFDIIDGEVKLNTDEDIAQGERGRKTLYVNTIAILFYWFAVVEDGKRMDAVEIDRFIEQYPELFKNFEDDTTLDRLIGVMEDINSNLLSRGIYLNNLTRVPVTELPDYGKPIPEYKGAVGKTGFADYEDIFSIVATIDEPFNVDTVHRKSDQADIAGVKDALDFFLRSGFIVYAGDGSPASSFEYRRANIPAGRMDDIRHLLKGLTTDSLPGAKEAVLLNIQAITGVSNGSSNAEEGVLGVGWRDIGYVFDMLGLFGRAPVRAKELLYFMESHPIDKTLSLDKTKIKFSLQKLMQLGLVTTARQENTDGLSSYTLGEFGYVMVPELFPLDVALLKDIVDMLSTMEGVPHNADISGIRDRVYRRIRAVSTREAPSVIDEDGQLTWDGPVVLFRSLISSSKELSLMEIRELLPWATPVQVSVFLEALEKSGAIVRRSTDSEDVIYALRDEDAGINRYIERILVSIETPIKTTDYSRVRSLLFPVLIKEYLWDGVIDMMFILLAFIEADKILVEEGLDEDSEYSSGDIQSFFERNFAIAQGKDRSIRFMGQYYEYLMNKHKLKEDAGVIFLHRIREIRENGRSAVKWEFSAEGISNFITDFISTADGSGDTPMETLSERMKIFTPEMIGAYFYIFENIGIIERNREEGFYKVASFIDINKAEAIRERLDVLKGKNVSANHFQYVRDLVFKGVVPDWNTVAGVFSVLSKSPEGTLTASDIMSRSLPTGKSGSRTMFLQSLKVLADLGLVERFTAPRKASDFDKMVFHAQVAGDQYLRKIGGVFSELEDTPIASTDLGDLRGRIYLEVLPPTLRGALYVFEALQAMIKIPSGGETPGFPTMETIKAVFSGIESENLIKYLDFLISVGLVDKIRSRSEGVILPNPEFRAVRMYGGRYERIKELLGGNTPLADVSKQTMKTRVLEVTETRWAGNLKRDIERVSGTNGKIVIGIATDWIPTGQQRYIQELLRAVDGLGDIIIVRKPKEDLIEELHRTVAMQGMRWDRVVLMAGLDTVQNGTFLDDLYEYDVNKNSFVVGINNINIKDDTYIRLLEMLSMALSQAFERRFERHPKIDVSASEGMYDFYIYTPAAEKIDIGEISRVYRAQQKVLTQA